jgi:hypothetical protein
MNAVLQRLRAEIGADRRTFSRHVEELRAVSLGPNAESGDLARAAIALHHAYGAIESILSRVCRELERTLPTGPDWHQALLDSMALDLQGVRPAILSQKSLVPLRRLLGFRHFFRHAYAVSLDGEQLATLRNDAEAALSALEPDLDRLDDFLRELTARTSG